MKGELRVAKVKNTKIIKIGLAILVIFSLLLCCSSCRYGAKLYSRVNDWIDESFLKENRVKGFYPNDNYVYDESDPSDKYIYDETAPSSRVFIITDEDEYNRIFTNSPLDIDFKKQMVILYIFSNTSPRDYKLKRIELKDKVLTVKMRLERKKGKDAVMLYQRCILIKMNKAEINEVKFENGGI